jgi:hypothetical protein
MSIKKMKYAGHPIELTAVSKIGMQASGSVLESED